MSRNTDAMFVTVTTDEAEQHALELHEIFERSGCTHRLVPYWASSPGMGKTSTARRVAQTVADQMGRVFTEHNPSPTDDQFGFVISQFGNKSEEVVSGLPWADKDRGLQMRAMAQDFPRSGRGIWLIDEPFQTQYAWRFVAQIVSDGRIGNDYILPDGWFVILAGNAHTHRAGTIRIPTHMQNRIMQFNLVAKTAGALAHFELPATPEIGVYLRWFGDGSEGSQAALRGKLDCFDPKADGPYATARTWDKCNTLIHFGKTPESHFPMFQGYLGHKTALDLKTCYTAIASLPNINQMLDRPEDYRDFMESTHAQDPTRTAALAFVVLRRLDHERDVESAGKAIRLFRYASLEATAAFIAVADDIDQKHKDGAQVLDHAEYARLVADYPHILAN